MAAFGVWLQKQLNKNEWTQSDLARETGLSTTTISKYIAGPDTPSRLATIESLARALRVSTEEVQASIRGEDAVRSPVRSQEDILAELEANAAVPVPMITDLVAHMGSGGGFVDDYVYLTPDYRRGRKKTIIGIYAKGDCMAPEIRDGDAVVFDQEERWEPDDVVVAAVDGQAVVRRLVEISGRMVLRSDADGETHLLTEADSIFGKVIWVMHRMVRLGKNGSNGRRT